MRPEGLLTVTGIQLADGREVTTQQAVDYGWICPSEGSQPAGWGLERHEVPVGRNLFLDQGRQAVAYAFGFRSPIQNYTCQKFGVGTGVTAARVTDVALEAPILLSGSVYTKNVDAIDYIAPFVIRIAFTLGVSDANGYIVSEMGLYTGADVLVARKVRAVSVNKTSDFATTLSWRIRF